MTQMVMSRGVLHSLPDTPPSLRYSKGHFLPDNEDVMVMDTKLKIIEILQVSATLWMYSVLFKIFQQSHKGVTLFLCHFTSCLVHPECEVRLQDHIFAVHLQERVWGQDHN